MRLGVTFLCSLTADTSHLLMVRSTPPVLAPSVPGSVPLRPRPGTRCRHACPLLVAGLILLSGCTSMHVKRATYQMLRQGDCQLNAFDEFDEICDRSFAAEYHEYERLRNDFLHENRQERPAPPAANPLAAL